MSAASSDHDPSQPHTEPPTPVKALAGAMKRIANDFIDETGKYRVPDNYRDRDAENMVTMLESHGQLGKKLRKEIEKKGNDPSSSTGRRGPRKQGGMNNPPPPDEGPNNALLVKLEKELATRSNNPMSPEEACRLFQQAVDSTEPALEIFVQALERSCRGLCFGSRDQWDAAMTAAGFDTSSLRALVETFNEVEQTIATPEVNKKATEAVRMITLLDEAESTTNADILIRSIACKIRAIEACGSYSALTEAEKKLVRKERYAIHCNEFAGAARKTRDNFVSDMAKDALGWKRITRMAMRLGPYVLLDPGYSLQSLKSNSRAGVLSQLCMDVIENVIGENSEDWFRWQDECSIQGIMAILFCHAPYLIQALVPTLKLIGVNISDTDGDDEAGDDGDKDEDEDRERGKDDDDDDEEEEEEEDA